MDHKAETPSVRPPRNRFSRALVIVILALLPHCDRAPPQSPQHPAAPTSAAASPRGRPDVLLITCCTLRARQLGAYGYSRDTTPTLDALAEGGALFENHFTPAPWTRPGVASILTGLYPRSLNIDEPAAGFDERILHDRFLTIAEAFQQAGYATIGVSANPHTSSIFNFQQGFDVYDDVDKMWNAGYAVEKILVRQVNERFLAQLAHAPPEKPLFGFLLYVDAHGPYPNARQLPAFSNPTPRTLPDFIELYDRSIRDLDAGIGELLAELRQRRGDNLLVAVTADHGQELGDTRDVKRSHTVRMLETVLRVPWIVHYPARLPRGRRVTERTSNLDVFPTIAGLAGIDGPPDAAGLNLAAEVAARKRIPHRSTFVAETMFGRSHILAIYADRRKLVICAEDDTESRRRETPTALFKLGDTDERVNHAQREPRKIEELRALLEEWKRDFPPLVDSAEVLTEMPEFTRDRLRGLGYFADD